ncbi:hypothetical protein LG311_19085 [Sutcliffiella horikoshii]|uniref:hypothetical protein n=1 Tax=Sutcliffiella horikoshii TaxID=79883 RepID=UPI00384B5BB0
MDNSTVEKLRDNIRKLLLIESDNESNKMITNSIKKLKEKGAIKNIDDFCQFFFDGEQRYEI